MLIISVSISEFSFSQVGLPLLQDLLDKFQEMGTASLFGDFCWCSFLNLSNIQGLLCLILLSLQMYSYIQHAQMAIMGTQFFAYFK